MTEEKLKKIYRRIRMAIFAIPAIVVAAGLYLVLFPVDGYNFFADDPKLSKFEIEKNVESNQLSFGVFPPRAYRFVDFSMSFRRNTSKDCQAALPEVNLSRTYKAFLYPEGDPVVSEDQLREILFAGNKTSLPNGSLLHSKATNEVFLVALGAKILFPGPEIFEAFGYSFGNLTEAGQSDIDQFPDADTRVFLWTIAHPDGTIFQAFPSHNLYIVFDGKKHRIENREFLDKIWPENFSIAVSDSGPQNILGCSEKKGSNKVSCQMDAANLSSIGRYYHFTMTFPPECSVENAHPDKSRIRFFSEKSFATVKESLKTIAASVLNRYFFKQ